MKAIIDLYKYVCFFFRSLIRSIGYIVERREGIDIKGKGVMDTYFMNGVSNDFDPSRNNYFSNDHRATPKPIQVEGNPSPPTRPQYTQSGDTLELSSVCSVI